MQHAARLILLPLLAAAMTAGVWARDAAKETAQAAEYQRSDTNFYGKGDVVKAHPSAVIIPEGSSTRKGDSYFITPHQKAPKEIYLETLNDWIEPITPPDMPASLGVPPDAMQIREPQGDVQVALPSAPANFAPVTDGMTLPNGAVVKTGANGTAAVLFGGVDSARLIPNSAAAVQQTVTAQSRSAEVDLTTGAVFSKVGSQVGVKGEYKVQTPCGVAIAHGGDFVTLATRNRTDVWVAQGNVQFVPVPGGKNDFVATSDGTGPLKIIRFPQIPDPHLSVQADVETLTTILNFVPLANQKIKTLRDKKANGVTLTANEQDYLKRIKEVPCLIKLALVEPPAPAPAPAAASAPTTAPAPAPANPKPINVVAHPDGTVKFQGAAMGLAEFQSKLETVVKATPEQSIVIKSGTNVPYEKIKEVLDICATAGVRNVSVATPVPATTPAPAVPGQIVPVQINLRADGLVDVNGAPMDLDNLKSRLADIAKANPTQPLLMTGRDNVTSDQLKKVIAICHAAKLKVTVAKPPVTHPTPPPVAPAATQSAPTPAAAAAAATTTAPAPPSPADLKPLRAVVRVDGKINFQGATYELPGFKSKLEAIIKATPDQSIVIKAGQTVPYEKFEAVMDICHSAQVKNLTVATPAPTPKPVAPAAVEPPATNLPAPALLMHPSTESMSSNAPPEAPSAPPETNAPTPAGP
jgi:biopolymer transport protein ExbD